MKTKVLIVFVFLLCLAACFSNVYARGKGEFVDTSEAFVDALASVSDGETIYVTDLDFKGGSVLIDKSIKIIGSQGNSTFTNASFWVADGVSLYVSRIDFIDCGTITLTGLGESSFEMCGFTGTNLYADTDKQLAVSINGCIFSKNSSYFGGAVCLIGRNNNITLLANNCHFRDNLAVFGGAVYTDSVCATFIKCFVYYNKTLYPVPTGDSFSTKLLASCGNLLFDESSTLTDGFFISSASSSGGGLFFKDSILTLFDCKVFDNDAQSGGGVYCVASDVIIDGCVIAGNTAQTGGAVFAAGCTTSIINCSFYLNMAQTYASLYVSEAQKTSIVFCSFFENINYETSARCESSFMFGCIDLDFDIVKEQTANGYPYNYITSSEDAFSDGLITYEYANYVFKTLGHYSPLNASERGMIIMLDTLPDELKERYSNFFGTLYVGSNYCESITVNVYIDSESVETVRLAYSDTLVLDGFYNRGHSLSAWKLESGLLFSTSFLSFGTDIKEISIYAEWVANIYNLYFDVDGEMTATVQTFGMPLDLPVPKMKGYSFKGWYSEKDGKGGIFQMGDLYDLTFDITLYAYFKVRFPTTEVCLIIAGVIVLAALSVVLYLRIIKKLSLSENNLPINNESSMSSDPPENGV